MSKKLEFPSINTQPKALLQNIARDHGDSFQHVLVIGLDENGEFYIHVSDADSGFLSMASIELTQIAYRSLQGDFD